MPEGGIGFNECGRPSPEGRRLRKRNEGHRPSRSYLVRRENTLEDREGIIKPWRRGKKETCERSGRIGDLNMHLQC